MALTIRPATSADLPVLIQLYADMDGSDPLPTATAQHIFAAIDQNPDYRIYLALHQQEAIGTFSLLMAPTMMHRGIHKFALLDAVTVRSDCRDQGIGKSMVQAAIGLSAEAGCYKMMLSSNLKREQAHKFYESLGFRQHGWSFSLQLMTDPAT